MGEWDGYVGATAIFGVLDLHSSAHGIAIKCAYRQGAEALELPRWQLVAFDEIGE